MEFPKKLSRLVARLLQSSGSRNVRPVLLVPSDVWTCRRSLEESRGLDTVQNSKGSHPVSFEVELEPTLERPYDHKYKIDKTHLVHQVVIRNDYLGLSEIALWCSQNLTGNWTDELTLSGYREYYFQLAEDATLFTLRWS